MTDDSISRQATIDALRSMQTYKLFEGHDLLLIDQAAAMTEMMLLPSADAVQHGHWIESDTDGFVCSVCRNGYRNQPTLMGKPMFEYCPVCGARMGGEQNG